MPNLWRKVSSQQGGAKLFHCATPVRGVVVIISVTSYSYRHLRIHRGQRSGIYSGAWVRQENNVGIEPILGDVIKEPDWQNQFKHMGFPETTIDKLNALLSAYADSTKGDYLARIPSDNLYLITKIAAKNTNEIQGLAHLLEEMGYLEKDEKAYGERRISARGWLHVDELHRSTVNTNSAFIAMWFHETTEKYREAVIAAIKHCDYKPVILDQEEYNGFIMEQAVSQIKQARFVVADFTCKPEFVEGNKVKAGVRGGVYWEAGMAYGLNKPVIHTCEDNEDAKNRRHFDIDQYNTIFWKPDELNTNIRNLSEKIDNPTFAEKLANRILWVVGRGSYKEQ